MVIIYSTEKFQPIFYVHSPFPFLADRTNDITLPPDPKIKERSITASYHTEQLDANFYKVGSFQTCWFFVNLFVEIEPITQEPVGPIVNNRIAMQNAFDEETTYNIWHAPDQNQNKTTQMPNILVLAYSLLTKNTKKKKRSHYEVSFVSMLTTRTYQRTEQSGITLLYLIVTSKLLPKSTSSHWQHY